MTTETTTVPVTFHVPSPPDGWEIPNPMRRPKKGEKYAIFVTKWSFCECSGDENLIPLVIFAYPKADPNQADWYDRIDALNLRNCWVVQDSKSRRNEVVAYTGKPKIEHGAWEGCACCCCILDESIFHAPVWRGDWKESLTRVVNGKAIRPSSERKS